MGFPTNQGDPAGAIPVYLASPSGEPVTGVLNSIFALSVAAANLTNPSVIVFNSSAAGRAVEVSFDNGNTFYAITPTQTSTDQLVFIITYPITTVQFTGAINDTYSIL